MWGDQRDGWLTELVQFAAFIILAIGFIIAVTATTT